MAKTEAQKRAQKNYMSKGEWIKLPLLMRREDTEQLKSIAEENGLPVGTYVKQAISHLSGSRFSWDN